MSLSLIRWAGGKGRQLNDLLPMIPHTRIYVEPFGGGASVLLNRNRSEIEVYNDLDAGLVNLFQVVRDDELFKLFCMNLEWVQYSRVEFREAIENYDNITVSNVNRAVMFFTMLNQSISGKRLASQGDWSRARLENKAETWHMRKQRLGPIHGRMRSVLIECRDALDVLQEWDGPDTTFYCDPPYVLETRSKRKYYAVEPGDDYHEELVDVMLKLRGNVVLSGYNHPVYDRLATEGGWITDAYGAFAIMQVTQEAADKQTRTEVVYRNPQAADKALMRPLFS